MNLAASFFICESTVAKHKITRLIGEMLKKKRLPEQTLFYLMQIILLLVQLQEQSVYILYHEY